MKTAVSLPDELFYSVDRLAKRLKLSRSELYRRALAEFLARHAPEELKESWESVIADVGQPDYVGQAAARSVFERVKW